VTGHQLLFVVDASPDGSARRLFELAAAHSTVDVIELSRHRGQHYAVMVGLRHARGDFVAIMDADLQDPPESLPLLLDCRAPEIEVVFGGRAGRYESRSRIWTSRLFKQTMSVLTGLPPDAGIYAVFSREVAARMLRLRVSRPMVVAMLGLCTRRHRSRPVPRNPRPSGRSSYRAIHRLRAGWWALRCVAEARLRPRPHALPVDYGAGLVARATPGIRRS
jgi:glycosyltransferase involved in cell wall biosynthesis